MAQSSGRPAAFRSVTASASATLTSGFAMLRPPPGVLTASDAEKSGLVNRSSEPGQVEP